MIALPPLFEVIVRADGLVDLVCDGVLVPRRGGDYRGWTLTEAEHVAERLDHYSRIMPDDGVDEETR